MRRKNRCYPPHRRRRDQLAAGVDASGQDGATSGGTGANHPAGERRPKSGRSSIRAAAPADADGKGFRRRQRFWQESAGRGSLGMLPVQASRRNTMQPQRSVYWDCWISLLRKAIRSGTARVWQKLLPVRVSKDSDLAHPAMARYLFTEAPKLVHHDGPGVRPESGRRGRALSESAGECACARRR